MTTPSIRFVFRRVFLLVLLPVLLIPIWSAHHLLQAAPRQPRDKDKDNYALIFGTVWGPDNHPVYGVKVKIRRARDKKKAKWEVYSNHSGEFAQRVPAGEGDYVLWADPKDLKTADGRHLRLPSEVTIHVYYDERVDTGLHLTQ